MDLVDDVVDHLPLPGVSRRSRRCRNQAAPSALGQTYGVDEDALLPVPADSGSSRSSSEFWQHDGVVTVVVEISCRASPSPCGREVEEGGALGFGEREGCGQCSQGVAGQPPLLLFISVEHPRVQTYSS
jgi:hypothetical protein